ncbi:MAG: hypothetical protein P0Y62_07055 [Candidatus Chryseobacterium colombiense]|nr:hypothetical protein [Chryseobacterium sp.]WEK71311.1 MAG: hypothetical protein P0Y62_07055 [Chryseobacterium sp.]
MNNQLSNISTQYRKFSKGQYIEHTQFNEFLDFFEDQDRLSRVMLQGVGIVCGLKPKLTYLSGQLSGIELSQGVALTTDGDLLTLNITGEASKDLYVSDLRKINIESKNYTHFKVYDNFKVKYPAFNVGNNQIELWELATSLEAASDFQPVSNLLNLDDKYLLLYLEDYEKEVKPCRGVDCDNHGVQQIRNLKVLVTTTEGIKNILGRDWIQPHPLFIEDVLNPSKLERVVVERLISERGVDDYFSPYDLKKLYSDVLERNGYGEVIFKKINEICRLTGVPGVDHQSFKSKLEACLAQKIGFQYAYDVVKDLTDTYSEIIKLLPKAFTKSLPDFGSFPKHIMLGKLILDTQLDSARHQFYNSPVLDDEKATQRVKLLVNRFKQQAQNFSYSKDFGDTAQIKIVPSKKINPLNNKTIPFYYQITDEFLKAWNFDKTSNRSYRDNLAYDTSLLSSNEHVQHPVDFNIYDNSFYYIEGHQGMRYQEAFEQIKKIRDEKQLGFDIMKLSLAELIDNKDMLKAHFNEYLEKHPGLEHRGGVEEGGTFGIVYEINGREERVVADFSLPYICCTPKVDVKLTLPETVICTNAAPIPFTVFPMNGVVKANSDLNAGVEIIDGRYFFNPSIVNYELYGQEITFTVNGKPTNCSIKVIQQSDVHIKIDSVTYPSGDSTATTVHFTVSESNFKDYTYSWDFWGDDHWVNLKPDGEGGFSYVFRELNPKIIPTIRVKVSLNGCTQDIAISDWYDAPAVPTIVFNTIYFDDKGVNCCEGEITEVRAEATGPSIVYLKDGSFELIGKSSGATSPLYSWTKIKGPVVTLTGVNKDKLNVSGLVADEYVFQLTVVDADTGLFAKSEYFVVNVYYEG